MDTLTQVTLKLEVRSPMKYLLGIIFFFKKRKGVPVFFLFSWDTRVIHMIRQKCWKSKLAPLSSLSKVLFSRNCPIELRLTGGDWQASFHSCNHRSFDRNLGVQPSWYARFWSSLATSVWKSQKATNSILGSRRLCLPVLNTTMFLVEQTINNRSLRPISYVLDKLGALKPNHDLLGPRVIAKHLIPHS